MSHNKFNLDEWRLIQDSIVENISYLKSRQQYGYEEEVARLEAMLQRVLPKTASAKSAIPTDPSFASSKTPPNYW